MAATLKFIQKLGCAVKNVTQKKQSSWWYTPHMAAASRAIAERIPLVDFVLEVRDARIPWSSKYEQLRHLTSSSRHILVLNKMDLANRSQMKEWMAYFDKQNCLAVGINSHNKENIKEFLNFLQARVREMKRNDNCSHTTTIMLIGVPNVGKSALANSLHQIGRISSAEKGRLKYSIVSPQPGETKDISSFKIASHPNIYVLDTPGILPPKILDDEVCSKLALNGVISDSIVGEEELAQYFLAILNLSKEHKKWAKLSAIDSEKLLFNNERQKLQCLSDHTQDFVVDDVRRTLFETVSLFNGNLRDEDDLAQLIEVQFTALQKAFHIPLSEDVYCKVIKEKMNDMNAVRKAKNEAKEEEKAQRDYAKDLAKARTEVAHEVKLAKDAEAEMELHINKAASKAVEHQNMQNQGCPPTAGAASISNSGHGYVDAPEVALLNSIKNDSEDLGSTISGFSTNLPSTDACPNKKFM